VANRWSPVTIVAAITSRSEERVYPTKVPLDPPEGNLETPSVVLLNRIRTVDRRRLVRRLGRLRPESMRRVDRAIRISLGLAGV
jgi:mRNA interferase MazF